MERTILIFFTLTIYLICYSWVFVCACMYITCIVRRELGIGSPDVGVTCSCEEVMWLQWSFLGLTVKTIYCFCFKPSYLYRIPGSHMVKAQNWHSQVFSWLPQASLAMCTQRKTHTQTQTVKIKGN